MGKVFANNCSYVKQYDLFSAIFLLEISICLQDHAEFKTCLNYSLYFF